MASPQASLQMQVLRAVEELLKDRPPDQRQVDTAMVIERMRLSAEAMDDIAQVMSQLLQEGKVRGKELRGDNKALDVTVTAITEKGLQLLWR